MDSKENVELKIKLYLQAKFKIPNISTISLSLSKMASLSNDIYHVIAKDVTSNEIIDELLYRNFGEISDIINRDLEESVINSLSANGLGPKIFSTDHKTFRIEQFLTNSSPLTYNSLKTKSTISKMIPRFLSYSEIAPIYHFKITNGAIEINQFDPNTKAPVDTKHNIYDLLKINMYNKSIDYFKRFKEDVVSSKVKMMKEDREIFISKLDEMSNFMDIVSEVFNKFFPKEGYFSINHNDTLRQNLLMQGENIFIIDHEFAMLNLIGFDIVNYLVETNYDYAPVYRFIGEEIDLDAYYEIYLQFIEKFEQSQVHEYFTKSSEGKKAMEKIKSIDYFIELVVLDIILWFVYGMFYLNYEKCVNKEGFDYFHFTYHRVVYYKKVLDYLKNKKQ